MTLGYFHLLRHLGLELGAQLAHLELVFELFLLLEAPLAQTQALIFARAMLG